MRIKVKLLQMLMTIIMIILTRNFVATSRYSRELEFVCSSGKCLLNDCPTHQNRDYFVSVQTSTG